MNLELLRDALEMIQSLPGESETTGRKRGETIQGHMDRMSDVMERNEQRRHLISAIEATLAQQAEPVISRPKERDYKSFVGYARALEAYCDALEQAEPVVVQAEPVAYQDTLSRESQQRERLDLRLAGRKKGPSADTEFAVPHLVEQAEPVVEPEHWVITTKVGDIVGFRAPGLKKGDKVYPRPQQQAEPVVEPEETYKAVPMKTVRTGVVTWDKQAEPVTWGVDWGEDEDCVSIVKRLPDGKYVVLAIERRPAKKQAEPTEGNPSY
jgi:hypothetical protein